MSTRESAGTLLTIFSFGQAGLGLGHLMLARGNLFLARHALEALQRRLGGCELGATHRGEPVGRFRCGRRVLFHVATLNQWLLAKATAAPTTTTSPTT